VESTPGAVLADEGDEMSDIEKLIDAYIFAFPGGPQPKAARQAIVDAFKELEKKVETLTLILGDLPPTKINEVNVPWYLGGNDLPECWRVDPKNVVVAYSPDLSAIDGLKQALQRVVALESELAALKESTRWIPVDYEPAPKDLDNYGACSDVEGNAYWVRKPTEAK
jgi:hypothetical protein